MGYRVAMANVSFMFRSSGDKEAKCASRIVRNLTK